MAIQKAKFSIGDIVKHKHFEFRGVIYDVDFEFNNSEEWYQSIPKNVISTPLNSGTFGIFLSKNHIIANAIIVAIINGGIATFKSFSLS